MGDFSAAVLLAVAVFGGGFLGAVIAKQVGSTEDVMISEVQPASQHMPVQGPLFVADGN
jgi:hypothetical protein